MPALDVTDLNGAEGLAGILKNERLYNTAIAQFLAYEEWNSDRGDMEIM